MIERIDKEAVDRARVSLGINYPVNIYPRKAKRALGTYCFLTNAQHSIMVTTYHKLSDYDLSTTLWHELTHALQFQRLDYSHKRFTKEYWGWFKQAGVPMKAFDTGIGLWDYWDTFWSHPMEAEAKKNEKRAEKEPLVYAKG